MSTRTRGPTLAREAACLSAEEEAALLAEWGQEGIPQDFRSLLTEGPAPSPATEEQPVKLSVSPVGSAVGRQGGP